MDRNSYSHGQLQELFFPVAVMLVKYDKIDKEALSPALIHGTMFLDSSSKNYVDYFDFHLLESAFNSDKYIRNCIIQLIGTGGEFEEKKFNGSHQRSYYYKNMINGVEKQKILADLLGIRRYIVYQLLLLYILTIIYFIYNNNYNRF